MKKTLLIVVIAIALVVSSFIPVQATTATADLRASSTSVKPGETVTVTLSAATDGGIALVSGNEADDGFAFNYDSNKLELISKEAKKLIDLNEEATSGTICLMGSSVSFLSGDIYELTFRVKSDAATGNTVISTTPIIITDFDDEETTITGKTVTIQIESDATPTDPVDPVDPTDPTDPTDPVDPTDPTDPTNPVEPTDPTDPTEPTNPTDPSNGGNTDRTNYYNTDSTSKTSTSGKITDNSTASTILPKTGSTILKGFILLGLTAVAIFMYKKLKQYRGI